MSNESYAFSYDAKRGLEIEFKPRAKIRWREKYTQYLFLYHNST
jgi:hypothetical protein